MIDKETLTASYSRSVCGCNYTWYLHDPNNPILTKACNNHTSEIPRSEESINNAYKID